MTGRTEASKRAGLAAAWCAGCRRQVPLLFSASLFVFGVANSAIAATFHVATTGSDANPGSTSRPWRTIQKAANTVSAGSTVLVRGGVYRERVTITRSGTASRPIVFASRPGDRAVLDGKSIVIDSDKGGFWLEDISYVRIEGFEIRNYRTGLARYTPAGIWVLGAGRGVVLKGNLIHDIATTTAAGNAHGIAVYGTRAPGSIRDIVIEGNELRDLRLGFSESLVVNGNVDGFRIIANHVHHNDNIGIDAIGHERVSRDPVYDQARNGLIAENRVHDIDSRSNPAYRGDAGADGIYVDGGRDIVIERNVAARSNIGIEVASEHAGRSSSNIVVRNNFVHDNHIVGITLGGYSTRRGFVSGIQVLHNTLLHNDRFSYGQGEIMLQHDVRDSIIENNIVVATTQGWVVTNRFTANTGNRVDRNVFWSAGGLGKLRWQWKSVVYRNLAAWRAGTGNDASSLATDPLLVSTSTPDLHLRPTSPAIDRAKTNAGSGRLDIDGDSRRLGARADIGADEVVP